MSWLDVLSWAMSGITITTMWLTGNKWRHVWLCVLGNQVLWVTWIIGTHSWGLSPCTLFIAGIAIRNHLLWRERAKQNIAV